jgi:tetratricopeptide (TPR) repeat protein
VKLFKSLFGANPQKFEDKADELRLDLEYRDAAYYYQKAIEATDPQDAGALERLHRKRGEVRRAAYGELIKDAAELVEQGLPALAHEKLETASSFADEESQKNEVERRLEELDRRFGGAEPVLELPEPEVGVEGDLFELALTGYDPEDRARAEELGEPFRNVFEACQREAWEEALPLIEALLAEHPDEVLLHELAGMAAEHSGRLEDALESFRRAHELRPDRSVTVSGLAAALRKSGRFSDARKVLGDAVARRPASRDLPEAWVPIHIEYALALSEDGHHDAALATGAALLEARAADRGMIYFNMAGVLERAGRLDDCRAALEAAIQASPRMPLYRERLADFLVKRQVDLDTALNLLVGANEAETAGPGTLLGGGASRAMVSPHRGRYLYKMARIYFLKGEDLEAQRTITTALAVSRDPEVLAALEELKRDLKEQSARR